MFDDRAISVIFDRVCIHYLIIHRGFFDFKSDSKFGYSSMRDKPEENVKNRGGE